MKCVHLSIALVLLAYHWTLLAAQLGCELSPWTLWSECSQPCGTEGVRTRSRLILRHYVNWNCPWPLKQTQSCNRDCKLCRYGECLTTGTPKNLTCICHPGFTGPCCQHVNCATLSCSNGGTCSQNPQSIGFPCSCPLSSQTLDCKGRAPHLLTPTATELEQAIQVKFTGVHTVKEWTSNRERLFKTLVAEVATVNCVANPDHCCNGVDRNEVINLFRAAKLTQSQVHRIPNFPVLRGQHLVIGYHVLYKSHRLSSRCKSAGIPKDAVVEAIIPRRHSFSAQLGLAISSVEAFNKTAHALDVVLTTKAPTPPPKRTTTATAPPATTPPAPTITTRKRKSVTAPSTTTPPVQEPTPNRKSVTAPPATTPPAPSTTTPKRPVTAPPTTTPPTTTPRRKSIAAPPATAPPTTSKRKSVVATRETTPSAPPTTTPKRASVAAPPETTSLSTPATTSSLKITLPRTAASNSSKHGGQSGDVDSKGHEDQMSNGMIAGIVVGIFVVIVAAITVGTYLWHKKKKRRTARSEPQCHYRANPEPPATPHSYTDSPPPYSEEGFPTGLDNPSFPPAGKNPTKK